MKRLRLSLFLAGFLVLLPLALGAQAAKLQGNPYGLLIVRFTPGTSSAEMQTAVTKAGGALVTDLGQISAEVAASMSSSFAANIAASKGVVAVFPDKRSALTEAFGGTTDGPPSTNLVDSGDPWHAAFQWDDGRVNLTGAWAKTKGSGATVAVIDSGVQAQHKDLKGQVLSDESFIPCNQLTKIYGSAGVKDLDARDCSDEDSSGHGTFVSARIAGALNGFASNGIAPDSRILDEKVLAGSTTFFDSSWAIAAMLDACDRGADVLNLSLIVYDDPASASDRQDFLLWNDAVKYCLAKGAVLVAGAGNDHVRVNRVSSMSFDDGSGHTTTLSGVGQVDKGSGGIGIPGPSFEQTDLRGLLVAPAGVPGVIMVSATNNAIADAGDVPNRFPAALNGVEDQLTYYSNYGSRVDIAAPGGARAYNLPSYDAGPGDVYTGPWGIFSALDSSGDFCRLVPTGCFKAQGSGFGWLQGTSMSTAEVSGVVALMLSASSSLAPAQVLARLQQTATTSMVNHTGPLDASNTSPTLLGPCSQGFCHLDFAHPVSFADAYGAGLVNAAAAVK